MVTPSVGQVPAHCKSSATLTCQSVSIDANILGQQFIELPGGFELKFLNNVGGNKNAYHYGGDGSDLLVTYNPSSGGLHGHLMTASGRSFTIENCRGGGHVLNELDVENLGYSTGIDSVENREFEFDIKSRQVPTDNTTMATYSVKFYYTPTFAAETPDIEGFIDQIITETNQGYANSKVAMTVVKHCSELASIDDQENSLTMLNNFQAMKSSVLELRGSADAAHLLVFEFKGCGIGYTNVISFKSTLSATKKACAVGQYSFGHEIAHNAGSRHNQEASTGNINTAYPYGHGHLIDQGSASTGYRTILAYSATGHQTRVNYYSNPDVIYPPTGTRTGDAVSNNAALLNLNRLDFAAIGDESSVCVDGER